MNSIFKNSFLNFFSQVLSFLFGFFLTIILARYLGTEQMGEYSYLTQLITTISLVCTLGLPTVLTRFVASFSQRNDNNVVKRLIGQTLINETILALIVSIGALILTTTFFKDNQLLYFVVFITLPFLVLNNILRGALQGLQHYGVILRINIIISTLNFLCSLFLIIMGKQLFEILVLNFLIQGLTVLFSIYAIRSQINFKAPKIESKIFKEMANYTVITSAIVLLDLVLMERSEIFFLKAYANIREVGFYSISFGLVYKLMSFVPGSITGVMMPVIAGLHGKEDHQGIKFTYFNTTRYLLFITIPIIFAGLSLSDLFIQFVYGNDYLPMVPVIKILLFSGGLTAIAAAASSVLYGINKQSVILKMGLIMVAINLVLDFLLIPTYASTGAAIANAVAQTSAVIIGIIYTIKIAKMPFPYIETIKITLAATLSFLITAFLISLFPFPSYINFILLSIIFALLYFLSLSILKFFNNHDRDVTKKIQSYCSTLWRTTL